MSTPTIPVDIEQEGGVARIILNRPQAGNAINMALAHALMRAAMHCDENDTVRCVILTARGKMFCAGGDIPEFANAGDDVGFHLKEITAYLHVAVARLLRMTKPLIVAVNGPAAGAGFGLSIAGDVVVASRSARFLSAYGALGYTPDGGLTWLLPRLVGLRRAQEILLTNKTVTADEAKAIGLVTDVVDDEDLMSAAMRVAAGMAKCSHTAIGKTRSLLIDGASASLEAHLDQESRFIAESGKSSHGQAGIKAFLAKVPPEFT